MSFRISYAFTEKCCISERKESRGFVKIRFVVPSAESNNAAGPKVFVKDPPALKRIKRILCQRHGAGGGSCPGVNHRGLNHVKLLVAASQVAAAFIIV